MAADPNTHLRRASNELGLAIALLPKGTPSRRKLEQLRDDVDALTVPK